MVEITKIDHFHKKVRTTQHWFLPLFWGGGYPKKSDIEPSIKSDITLDICQIPQILISEMRSCPLDLKVMRSGHHILDISANSPCLRTSFHPLTPLLVVSVK
jgi:hypothetical protein